MTLAEKLKTERKRLDLTQEAAALVCGVSPREWWKWENLDELHFSGITLRAMEGSLLRLRKRKLR